MSHFTCLVVAKSMQDLEDKLMPYHEYECTGIEAYLEFVGKSAEELQNELETGEGIGKHLTELYSSVEEFANNWYGYDECRDGVWGRMTNPNAEWDWWVVGGRWTGSLILKNENAWAGIGKPGLLTKHSGNPLEVDYAPKGALDWDAMGDFQTFAFINKDGKWVSRENMGWFAITSPNENTEQYDRMFKEFIESLEDSDTLWVVDCHI